MPPHPAHICAGTGAHPAHIWVGTGRTPATSASGLGALPPTSTLCAGTRGCAAATSDATAAKAVSRAQPRLCSARLGWACLFVCLFVCLFFACWGGLLPAGTAAAAAGTHSRCRRTHRIRSTPSGPRRARCAACCMLHVACCSCMLHVACCMLRVACCIAAPLLQPRGRAGGRQTVRQSAAERHRRRPELRWVLYIVPPSLPVCRCPVRLKPLPLNPRTNERMPCTKAVGRRRSATGTNNRR